VLALAAAPLSCSDGAPAGNAADQNGDIALTLTAGGITLTTVQYVVTGPGGFSQSGALDVSKSATISTLIGAIPAGNGYSITLSATGTNSSSCSGAAAFSVVAQQTVPVSVELMCHEVRTTGSVLINGTLNVCAALNDVSAAPNETSVGGTIALSALASDSDGPGPISYQWTATTGGTISGGNGPNPSLVCTAPGTVTVSVTVSDGDPLCQETGKVTVTCLAGDGSGSGGSGGGGAGMSATGGTGGASAGSGAGGVNAGGAGAGGASAGTGGNAAGGVSGTGGSGTAGTSGGAGSGGNGTAGGAGAGAGGAGAGGAGGAGAGGAGAGGAGAGGAGAGGAGAGAGGASAGASGAAGSAGSGGTSGGRDLVVYRVGDGSGSLVNTGNPVFIDEYSQAGVLVRSTKMPTADSGSTHALVASGTATSEGLITLSTDGHFVMLSGYDATPGGSSSIVSGTAPRVVGRLDALVNIDTSTALTDWASGNNPRSVASTDGTNLWVAGAAGGVRFTTLGSTTSTQLSTTVANIRQTSIFASQLYVSDSSGSAVRLGTVGTGLPTTAGQTITNLTGIPTGGSPYGFFFADLDDAVSGLDTLYIADDGAGLVKYALISGTWTAEGTVGTATDAYRGLTGSVANGVVTLFAVRKGGSTATGGGEFVSLVDGSGRLGAFSSTPTLLATAAGNEAFRGVAFAPLP
jgi:hypothetical protein